MNTNIYTSKEIGLTQRLQTASVKRFSDVDAIVLLLQRINNLSIAEYMTSSKMMFGKMTTINFYNDIELADFYHILKLSPNPSEASDSFLPATVGNACIRIMQLYNQGRLTKDITKAISMLLKPIEFFRESHNTNYTEGGCI